MSGITVKIRGYTLKVEAKSGSQLQFIVDQLEARSDEWLELHCDINEVIRVPDNRST